MVIKDKESSTLFLSYTHTPFFSTFLSYITYSLLRLMTFVAYKPHICLTISSTILTLSLPICGLTVLVLGSLTLLVISPDLSLYFIHLLLS